MLTRFSKRAAILTVAALCSLPLAAQRPGGGGPPAGAADASQRHEFVAGYLGLTDSQKEQVKVIFAPMQSAQEAMRGQMQSKQEELQAAVKANQRDQQIEQIAAAIGALHAQQIAGQAKVRAKFYAILTPEQKEKLAAFERNSEDLGGRPGGGRP
jgi:Spy/CpxP family protein refolding chaperone